jgi:hypothetical protein
MTSGGMDSGKCGKLTGPQKIYCEELVSECVSKAGPQFELKTCYTDNPIKFNTARMCGLILPRLISLHGKCPSNDDAGQTAKNSTTTVHNDPATPSMSSTTITDTFIVSEHSTEYSVGYKESSNMSIGPTLGIGVGVGGDILNKFNPDIRTKLGIGVNASSENHFSMNGEAAVSYSYLYLNPAHRVSGGYNIGINMGDIANFTLKTGLFGQWGKISDGENGKPDSKYWSFGYIGGLGYSIVSPRPNLPISLNLGGEILLGGGQKNDAGKFFVGGGAELMLTWYI